MGIKIAKSVLVGIAALTSAAIANVVPGGNPPWEVAGAVDAPASDPKTYPDEEGFAKRARIIIEGVATNDLGTWRRGYFTGGDPGKYLPNAAMARLTLDPNDAEAIKYMNDDRTPKEHYHFAAVNWARFYPQFGDVLTPETKRAIAQNAGRYTDYLTPKGTENHRTMSITAGNIMPLFIEGDRLANVSKQEALRRAKENLRRYVRGLYHGGAGEWDSSTYYMFTVNGMLAIHDFHSDPECRLLAKAALDWITATYAIKYTDGVYTAPNQRGFAESHASSIADQTGWLWWGSPVELTPEQTKRFLYAMHPALSSFRPNAVVTNIARRNLPGLPLEQRSNKPNYWYGHERPMPTPNAYQETVYIHPNYTLASLWNGSGGQITRFMMTARQSDGAPIVLTGGTPAHFDHNFKRTGNISYQDGTGNYDQTAQHGAVFISAADIPEDETWQYSFFSLPEGVEPQQRGRWMVMQVGDAYLALHPLNADAKIGQTDLTDKQQEENAKLQGEGKAPRHTTRPIIRYEGRRTGFILQTAGKHEFESLDAFVAAVTSKTSVDVARFAQDGSVRYTGLDGKPIEFALASEGRFADVSIAGQKVTKDDFEIFSGPFVKQTIGVLEVSDGKAGYVVDFTGDLPVYRAK